tara:strand:+ start:180 stop:1148 length:969 start_codon:yes stop_codon:yes gene_type:complete
MKKILITGCLGFIGFHVTERLKKKKSFQVYGIDNINNYYNKSHKLKRFEVLKKGSKTFKFTKLDITDHSKLNKYFRKNKFDYVIHLAAQAGVRYSIENPQTYLKNNIIGFFNVLNLSKELNVKHLLFASTSSVYGNSTNFPLKEKEDTSLPLSFYAATKKSNEVMAHSYSNIFKLPCTALRFFTVYGPYGRPDMALYKFVNAISKSEEMDVFNYGNHIRDFTYISDVVDAIEKLILKSPKKEIPYDVFNVGGGNPQTLKKYISTIEKKVKKRSKIRYLRLQLGDIIKTHADISRLKRRIGYKPKVKILQGISNFVDWYNERK